MIEQPLSRFLRKIGVSPTGCWGWQAAILSNGYGMFFDGSKQVGAHRFSYRHFVGCIPLGLDLDHLCRNRGCVNPDHLEPVSRKENCRRSPLIMRPNPNAREAIKKALALRWPGCQFNPWGEWEKLSVGEVLDVTDILKRSAGNTTTARRKGLRVWQRGWRVYVRREQEIEHE